MTRTLTTTQGLVSSKLEKQKGLWVVVLEDDKERYTLPLTDMIAAKLTAKLHRGAKA
jgi:hypothetical protein